MRQVNSDRLAGQIFEEVGLPVPLQPGRIKSVEPALQHWKRHRPEELERRRVIRANRPLKFLRPLDRPVIAPNNPAHFLKMQRSRKRAPGSTVRNAKKPLISTGACTMNSRYHFITSGA